MMLTLGQMTSHDQKSHNAPLFNHFYLRNAIVFTMLLVACDTELAPVLSQVLTHVDHLNLRNAMVPLTAISIM